MITRILILLSLAGSAFAQNIHLKDGRIIIAKALRREKEQIIATIEIPPAKPGEKPTTGEFGFPLTDIFKLDFERPEVLESVPNLIAEGKAQLALEKLDPVVKYYSSFREAPGSWWTDTIPLQIQALLALRKDDEAGSVAEQFARLAVDPSIKRYTKAFTAASLTRKKQHEAALALYDDAAKATDRREVLSLIAVNRGDSLLALGDVLKEKGDLDKSAVRYEEALLSYLRVPALYPSQRMFLPQSALGAASAYLGLDDFARARAAIKELKENFPETPEAKAADALGEKVDKREKHLADPTEENEPAKPPAA